jgi:hypothetical protein
MIPDLTGTIEVKIIVESRIADYQIMFIFQKTVETSKLLEMIPLENNHGCYISLE